MSDPGRAIKQRIAEEVKLLLSGESIEPGITDRVEVDRHQDRVRVVFRLEWPDRIIEGHDTRPLRRAVELLLPEMVPNQPDPNLLILPMHRPAMVWMIGGLETERVALEEGESRATPYRKSHAIN